ncbi:hypothetical protein FFLO_04170 [Filobasidium floriforme]|uniref:Uncharacterized protein n=1 Tax=Filobasidium floriforme TaxID=5210 RepID=A0A8K0JJJ3_9TREE|nr:uncharacterized protein HD553DRAFT_323531 [Filobasidium floriforme]KAG7531728.1 hypothetical protein FFLO_04170 [Filobasidium floriforme]KAH8085670.1 hypothetical protein HD553DRAFT_323531 [Filobasidium floriforme]
MTDYPLDIVNDPLAWFSVDGDDKTSEGIAGELSFNQIANPLSMSVDIPLHDTNGTDGLSYSAKWASCAALSVSQSGLALNRYDIAETSPIYPQGMLHTPALSYGSFHGIANGNSDSVRIPLQFSSRQVPRDECTEQYWSSDLSMILSDNQETTARSSQMLQLRDNGSNLSKASSMVKHRKSSRYAPHYAKVTKAVPSQKKTIESFNYEIAEPISYCSLELFAIWVEEYHWLDGDTNRETSSQRPALRLLAKQCFYAPKLDHVSYTHIGLDIYHAVLLRRVLSFSCSDDVTPLSESGDFCLPDRAQQRRFLSELSENQQDLSSVSNFFRTVLSFDSPTPTGPTISSKNETSTLGAKPLAIDESEFQLISYCTLEKLSLYIGLTWHRSLIGNQESILEDLREPGSRQRYCDIKFGPFEAWARAEAGIWIDRPPVICGKCFKAYGKFYAVNTINSGNGCRCPISIRRRERRERNQAAFPVTGSQM